MVIGNFNRIRAHSLALQGEKSGLEMIATIYTPEYPTENYDEYYTYPDKLATTYIPSLISINRLSIEQTPIPLPKRGFGLFN
jgi:hypothetical protein